MGSNFASDLLVGAYILTAASIIACITQIVFRKKVTLISACKVSVFLPLISIMIKVTSNIAQAYFDIGRANDMPEKATVIGFSNIFHFFSVGLILTLILLIIYAITKSFYDNANK